MKKLIPFLLLGLSLSSCRSAYIFSYFQDNGQDGLHLAYSEDGLKYTALNNNESYLTPMVGEDKLMRDPCIIQGPDGLFHMVWTVSWKEKGIGYANSTDLKNWSPQRYIPVMEHEESAMNCWAPEITYDPDNKEYMIYWATTIPEKFTETKLSGDNKNNHRMYYVTTSDFVNFSDTKLLIDPGFNCIDATIQKIDNEWVMFLKNETKIPVAEKNIVVGKSQKLTGPYTIDRNPISENWVEGPTYTKTKLGHTLIFDGYTRHQMEGIASADLKTWRSIKDEISFPKGTRHGTIFKVKKKVLKGLLGI
ncbi:Glycosyl hydrolases family 43 [Spirosomataceae bacterium TFI 002]|nr:Glycosyl hydrolases family 43 [Spirosomataceae bacterium TFI 002]